MGRQVLVVDGVDSHADTLHVAVITDNGGQLADAEFPTTAAGYTTALAFLSAHAPARTGGGWSTGGSYWLPAEEQASDWTPVLCRNCRQIGSSTPVRGTF